MPNAREMQIPSTPAASRAQRRREEAVRFRMATYTAICLAALVLGMVGDWLAAVPPAVAMAAFLVAYMAGGFHASDRALRELFAGSVNVDLLMIVAALGAAWLGAFAEGAVLLFLFSLSNTLESFVLGRTRRAIEALMDLAPEEAVVRRDGVETRVSLDALRIGDRVVVRPAERIPADGVIATGRTTIDQSAMTGESLPVEKAPGDPVFAGTLNQAGALELDVERLASESTLARIVRRVEEAQSEKADSQRFTDWFGQSYTFFVLGLALLTVLIPVLFMGEAFGDAFYRAMTVLVVASPCAVVISIPAAILSAITGAARRGILFKGGAHLERLAKLRAVAFDKTGTLTEGRPRLVGVVAVEGIGEERLLQWAASAERLSEHPLARAVVAAVEERGIELLPAEEMQAMVGHGVRARVDGRSIEVGRMDGMGAEPDEADSVIEAVARRMAEEGKSVALVRADGRLIGCLAISDALRPGALEALQALRRQGIEHMVMLTGDHPVVAAAIAAPLGIKVEAGLMPEDKLRVVRRLREQYGVVAMVGDGINDAPALAAATLGISLGGAGTDVALETADVVLMADDLRHLPRAVDLARRADRVIRQNLVIALGVMLALLATTYFGTLRLPFAVIGHEGSTVVVILNGLRLLFNGPDGAALGVASERKVV